MPAQRLPQVLVVEEGRGKLLARVLRLLSRDIYDVGEACGEMACGEMAWDDEQREHDEQPGRDEQRGLRDLRDRDRCLLRVYCYNSDRHEDCVTRCEHSRDYRCDAVRM